MSAELLAQPHLSVITSTDDAELTAIRHSLAHKIVIEGRADLETELGRLLSLGLRPTPKTLDLIGHTTSDKQLVLLGDWVIDATSPVVTSFFRGLADQDVLGRLGIHALRLLGCSSAASVHGRWTMRKLAEILGVEVFGANGPMFASQYDASGFAEPHRYLLVSASDVGQEAVDPRSVDKGTRDPRALDIDALPAERVEKKLWPARFPDHDSARAILRLVRRHEGSVLPGLAASPSCELAFPSTTPGHYHIIEVLLDGAMVRSRSAGIVYPVDDPVALVALIDALHDRP